MKPCAPPSSADGRRPNADSRHDDGPGKNPATAHERRVSSKTLPLIVLVVAVYALHQDFWNWQRINPLLLGILPVGLAYHVAYSLLAALMMAVLVKHAWPAHLERYEQAEPSASNSRQEGES